MTEKPTKPGKPTRKPRGANRAVKLTDAQVTALNIMAAEKAGPYSKPLSPVELASVLLDEVLAEPNL